MTGPLSAILPVPRGTRWRNPFSWPGWPWRLIDTAGVRESSDVIEQAGITRTNRALETADLVLEVADASTPRIKDFPAPVLTAPRLLILNKCDLGIHPGLEGRAGHGFPAATGEGRKELEEAIIRPFPPPCPVKRAAPW